MKELNKSFEFFHDLLWADLGEIPRRPMAVIGDVRLRLFVQACNKNTFLQKQIHEHHTQKKERIITCLVEKGHCGLV